MQKWAKTGILGVVFEMNSQMFGCKLCHKEWVSLDYWKEPKYLNVFSSLLLLKRDGVLCEEGVEAMERFF